MARCVNIAFEGERPNVSDGDAVECRTALGTWVPMIARSGPRYDYAHAIGGRCFLTVSVVLGDDSLVNWPAEDVRPAAPTSREAGE